MNVELPGDPIIPLLGTSPKYPKAATQTGAHTAVLTKPKGGTPKPRKIKCGVCVRVCAGNIIHAERELDAGYSVDRLRGHEASANEPDTEECALGGSVYAVPGRDAPFRVSAWRGEGMPRELVKARFWGVCEKRSTRASGRSSTGPLTNAGTPVPPSAVLPSVQVPGSPALGPGPDQAHSTGPRSAGLRTHTELYLGSPGSPGGRS